MDKWSEIIVHGVLGFDLTASLLWYWVCVISLLFCGIWTWLSHYLRHPGQKWFCCFIDLVVYCSVAVTLCVMSFTQGQKTLNISVNVTERSFTFTFPVTRNYPVLWCRWSWTFSLNKNPDIFLSKWKEERFTS